MKAAEPRFRRSVGQAPSGAFISVSRRSMAFIRALRASASRRRASFSMSGVGGRSVPSRETSPSGLPTGEASVPPAPSTAEAHAPAWNAVRHPSGAKAGASSRHWPHAHGAATVSSWHDVLLSEKGDRDPHPHAFDAASVIPASFHRPIGVPDHHRPAGGTRALNAGKSALMRYPLAAFRAPADTGIFTGGIPHAARAPPEIPGAGISALSGAGSLALAAPCPPP